MTDWNFIGISKKKLDIGQYTYYIYVDIYIFSLVIWDSWNYLISMQLIFYSKNLKGFLFICSSSAPTTKGVKKPNCYHPVQKSTNKFSCTHLPQKQISQQPQVSFDASIQIRHWAGNSYLILLYLHTCSVNCQWCCCIRLFRAQFCNSPGKTPQISIYSF